MSSMVSGIWRLRGPFQRWLRSTILRWALRRCGGLALPQFFGGGVRRGIARIGGIRLELAERLLRPGDVILFDRPNAKAIGRWIDA